MTEQELNAALDHHDGLVARCASGALSFADFDAEYDSFYPRCALDGHESTPVELEHLQRHHLRISLHARVWREVLCLVTDVGPAPGFIDPSEAVDRLRRIAVEFNLALPESSNVDPECPDDVAMRINGDPQLSVSPVLWTGRAADAQWTVLLAKVVHPTDDDEQADLSMRPAPTWILQFDSDHGESFTRYWSPDTRIVSGTLHGWSMSAIGNLKRALIRHKGS